MCVCVCARTHAHTVQCLYLLVTFMKIGLLVLSTSNSVHMLLKYSSPLPSRSAVTVTVKVAGIVAVELSSTCTVPLGPFQTQDTGLSGELPVMSSFAPSGSVIMCGSSRTGGGQSCATTPAHSTWQKISYSTTCIELFNYSYILL